MSKKPNIPKRGEMPSIPQRGEIWLAEFPKFKESRKPYRPCLVISNNLQNQYGKWIVIIVLTSKDIENIEPFEVLVKKTKETGIDKTSKLKFNYPQTLDKERLKEYLGIANKEIMEQAKQAWQIAFDVENW